MTPKANLIQFLNNGYKITRWPFFKTSTIEKVFGQDALKQLENEGVVRSRQGINYELTELLKHEN